MSEENTVDPSKPPPEIEVSVSQEANVAVSEIRERPPRPAAGPTDDLILGLVGAVGTDLARAQTHAAKHLRTLGFRVEEISLSSIIAREYGGCLPDRAALPYDDYVWQRMTAGDALRHLWDEAGAAARLAVEEIRRRRDDFGDEPPACAFILRSLKRPEEARLLREVYRGQFVLIGCHTPRETRIDQLADMIAKTRSDSDILPHRSRAERLAHRDEAERGAITDPPEHRRYLKDYGQSVEQTFPLADAYINLQPQAATEEQLERILDLVLGAPFITPTKDEVAMFHAAAAAVRSADLSRQVGSAVANDTGDIIAVGCNEVPRAGGGSYWEGDRDDARDFKLGRDANQDQRDRAIDEVFSVLKARKLLSDEALASGSEDFRAALDDTRVDGLIEFTRSTHAEMNALMDAARRGTSVEDAVLYTSTFPCHNCAKHIVAAGIRRVVFIEPYPKSLAERLHGDAITVDAPNSSGPTVHFEHFAGVAPVNYFALFETNEKRKDPAGVPLQFSAESLNPKLRANFHPDIFPFEEESIDELRTLRESHDSPTTELLKDDEGHPIPDEPGIVDLLS
jgi:deoxycytidylate deaminase